MLVIWHGPIEQLLVSPTPEATYEILLAHLSRRLRGAYSIGRLRRPSSVVRRSFTISNDFSSETTGSIATKFHIQPPGPLGNKIVQMVWIT